MSTRCQVEIKDRYATVRMYHHCDGYPTYMLKDLQGAYKAASVALCSPRSYETVGFSFTRDRREDLLNARTTAAFIISHNPRQYEPEDSNAVHGDAEWHYRITPKRNLHTTEPIWKVEIIRDSFEDEPVATFANLMDITPEQMQTIQEGRPY